MISVTMQTYKRAFSKIAVLPSSELTGALETLDLDQTLSLHQVNVNTQKLLQNNTKISSANQTFAGEPQTYCRRIK